MKHESFHLNDPAKPTRGRTSHIAVVVPARNEEHLLPRCLRSLQEARYRLPQWVTSDVIAVCDCCHDRTFALATHELSSAGAAVRTKAGAVGAARAIGVCEALRRFGGDTDQCWIANTDADCEVPADWLLQQLYYADRGVDAVTGIVDVIDFSEHRSHVHDRFRETYRVESDGSHTHVHGANFGVRATAYLRAGGWGDLPTAEDHDLWHRLKETGAACASDAAVCVVTSGRRVGRAPAGFADALAAHNEYAL